MKKATRKAIIIILLTTYNNTIEDLEWSYKSKGVTTWATSVVEGRKEGRKEGRNNRKEYHSTSRARKVRSKIKASYCNILKVS